LKSLFANLLQRGALKTTSVGRMPRVGRPCYKGYIAINDS